MTPETQKTPDLAEAIAAMRELSGTEPCAANLHIYRRAEAALLALETQGKIESLIGRVGNVPLDNLTSALLFQVVENAAAQGADAKLSAAARFAMDVFLAIRPKPALQIFVVHENTDYGCGVLDVCTSAEDAEIVRQNFEHRIKSDHDSVEVSAHTLGDIEPLAPPSVRLLAMLERALPEIASEAEQREHSGNDEYFESMKQLAADMESLIAEAKAAPVAPGSHAAAVAVILEALDYERAAFDGDTEVNGADLVDWFGQWRERAKAALCGTTKATVIPT